MRIAVVALSVALMIVCVIPGQIGAQALDPQTLIGEWTGKWVRQTPGAVQGGRRLTTNGAYRLVINKIEGQAVSADIYAEGVNVEGSQKTVEREVRGRLEGSTLTFGPTRFTVTEKEMRGTRTGPAAVEINLTKLK